MINALLVFLLLLTPGRLVYAQLVFPEDHGPHPDHRLESWYFNGHLTSKAGEQFAFHLGFFKLGLQPDPPQQLPERTSAWAAHEIYRAEFGLTDLDADRFYSYEHTSRAALDLAGAQAAPIRVWVYDWSVEIPPSAGPSAVFRLHAAWGEEAVIDLVMEASKPALIPRGQAVFPAGTSRNPIYWYSLTRMIAEGTVQIAGTQYDVDGLAWLDRIWRTASFSQVTASLGNRELGAFITAGQIAFNRFALQLNDGRELLVFEQHRRDGTGVPIPSGFLVSPDGSARRITPDELVLSETRYWTSSDGVRYPAGWRIMIPNEQLQLELTPSVADQEVRHSVRYWSGAVDVTGQAGDRAVAGHGHVALAGYPQRDEN